jgi:NhaP-type Na+/H+ or K+/H+ antiporter
MRSQLSLVQAMGFCLVCIALGLLLPIFINLLEPFEAGVPFWVVISALAVLLIGLVLGLLAGCFTRQFKPTRLQWLGIYVLCLVLFLGVYLLSTRGMQVSGTLPVVVALVVNFGMQLRSSRSQQSSYSKGAQE